MLLQEKKANEIMQFLKTLPQVKSCKLYGSFAEGKADKYSDVDLCLDVSGCNNGEFMKTLPTTLAQKFNVLWKDYAPSLAPNEYLVTIAIDEDNPFDIVDIKCVAEPHITTVLKSELENDSYIHFLKLWVSNCKHYLRGEDCTKELQKLGARYIGLPAECLSDDEILDEALYILEKKPPVNLAKYIANCRKIWEEK